MAQKLLQKGYQKVFALKGGWNEWLASEYPLEKRDPLPKEREKEDSEAPSGTEKESASSEPDDNENAEDD